MRMSGLLIILLAPASSALADPTDLASVPKAEVLESGRIELGVSQILYGPDGGTRDTQIQSLLGLFGRAELGLDADDVRGEPDWNLDGKFLLLNPDTASLGLAVGFDDWGADTDALVYLVATAPLGPVRITAGLGGTDDVDPLAGAEWDAAPNVALFAEYAGFEKSISGGMDWSISSRFGLKAYWTHETETEADTLNVTLSFGF